MNISHLEADTSPKGNVGIKKLNKVPILIVAAIIFLLILGLGFATYKRGEMVNNTGEDEVKSTSPVDEGSLGNMLDDWFKNRFRPKEEGLKPFDAVITPTELPPISDKVIEDKIDEAALKLSKLKHDLYLQSLSAPTSISMKTSDFSNISPSTLGSSQTPSIQNDSLALINAMNQGKQGLSIETKDTMFMKQKNSFDYLEHKKTNAYSKYELKTGTLIPGVLITGINSKLPGNIKAQVSENVYDTATGNYLLIPQGTTIVGKYSSHVKFGQDRVLISWNRLVFTDGKTLNIGNMGGIDQEGYSGFEDQVDNHYFQIFGSAFLLSVLSGDFFFEDGYLVIRGRTTSAQQTQPTPMEQAASQMIQKQLSVSPTIEIRPGYRFNIFVTKDIILEPLEN